MTSSFDDVRLPEYVESGAQGGPVFNTTILTLGTGYEQRNQNWAYPRHSWDISYGMFNLGDDAAPEALSRVRAFFYNRRGMARAFRFKDWSDFSATDTVIPTGGATGACNIQLGKTYVDDASNTYFRPVSRQVTSPIFKVDGTVHAADSCVLGLAVFTNLPTGVLTASFQFDIPVRFDTDVFKITLENVLAGEAPSLSVIEVAENSYTLNGLDIPS